MKLCESIKYWTIFVKKTTYLYIYIYIYINKIPYVVIVYMYTKIEFNQKLNNNN